MDDMTYRNIVALIGRYSILVKVKDADGYHAFTDLSGSEGRTVPLRSLTLVAAYSCGCYPRGHEWFIALRDIGRAIREISSSDREFMWRARRHDLSRNDVERIILRATCGALRLSLY